VIGDAVGSCGCCGGVVVGRCTVCSKGVASRLCSCLCGDNGPWLPPPSYSVSRKAQKPVEVEGLSYALPGLLRRRGTPVRLADPAWGEVGKRGVLLSTGEEDPLASICFDLSPEGRALREVDALPWVAIEVDLGEALGRRAAEESLEATRAFPIDVSELVPVDQTDTRTLRDGSPLWIAEALRRLCVAALSR